MKEKTCSVMIGTFKPSVQHVLFPCPFLHFQVGLGWNQENSFPLVNRQKPQHRRHVRNVGRPFACIPPPGWHLDAQRSGSVPPHLGGRDITSESEFPRCDPCSCTLMTPEAPKRDNSPTAWPGERPALTRALHLGIPLFHCQTHDLWGIWKSTTLWGEETKKFKMKLYIK